MKVYIASPDGVSNHKHTEFLRRAASAADVKKHELVSSPDAADLILLNDYDCGKYLAKLRADPLARRFPEKTLLYAEDDAFLPFLPGVYAAAQGGAFSKGRVKSYCYVSATFDLRNPFIAPADGPRDLLFSFLGSSSCLLRKRLYAIQWNRDDVLVEDTFGYRHWDESQTDRDEWRRRFAEITARSRFVLCPRGAGAGSVRLFEVMERGIAPVILSDRYVLPAHVNWDACSVRVAERDIKRLPEILERYTEQEAREMGARARRAWEEHFAPEKQFNALVTACAEIVAGRKGLPPERAYRRFAWPLIIAHRRAWEWVYGTARDVVLRVYKLRGKPLPFKRRAYED